MVSAFESLNDATLDRLDKGHTADDAAHAVKLLRTHGIDVRPSFLPFTPWTTRDDIVDLLEFAYADDLVGSIDPVQYTIRLLLPEGSLLLDHPDLVPFVGPWDPARLTYEWAPSDPSMDILQRELSTLVEESVERGETISETYAQLRVRSPGSLGRSLEHDHRSPAVDRELVLLRGTHRHATEGSHPMTEELTNYNQQMIEQFRANGGTMAAGDVMSMLLLTTTGARSGRTYLNPLAAYEEDGRLYVIAVQGGAPTNPDWYHNLVANPTVTVEHSGEKFDATVRVPPGRGTLIRSSPASSSRSGSSVSTRRRSAGRSRSWSSCAAELGGCFEHAGVAQLVGEQHRIDEEHRLQPGLARRIDVARRVVDEEHRRRLQAELGAHHLVDREVGLGDAQLARIEDHVELAGDPQTVEIGGESGRPVGEEADPGVGPDLADQRQDRVVDLSARRRPRRDRGRPRSVRCGAAPRRAISSVIFPVTTWSRRPGVNATAVHLVVPFGVAGKAPDYSVEVEERSIDHPPSAAAQHVERGTGAEPGDVLVRHRVRGGDVLGRAVSMVHHDLHRPARRQLRRRP